MWRPATLHSRPSRPRACADKWAVVNAGMYAGGYTYMDLVVRQHEESFRQSNTMANTTTTGKQETTIAIVGGGIGGLLTAIGLGRLGYNVHLFEQAPKFSEIGAGIAM